MPNGYDDELHAEFWKVNNLDLKPIAVAAQCLDNQWVSEGLLQFILDKEKSFADKDVAKRRLGDARNEYMRALLNSEQVIVNRAYFFNNPVVYKDYVVDGQSRDTFKNFLNTGAIVPFLISEPSPGVRPRFAVDTEGWTAWREVLADTKPHCLRLSWDDTENNQFVQHALFQRFRKFLSGLPAFDVDALQQDLSLNAEDAAGLARKFQEVAIWGWNEESVTREELFKKFVVVDGSPVSDGRYDKNKPFAAQIKQLVDLRYLTSLPDALNRFPLTPADSLHRTALQEDRQLRQDGSALNPDELISVLLRRQAFDLIQQPLSVSLDGLGLEQIWNVRQTEDWARYIVQLENLTRDPQQFDVAAQAVYDSYVQVATRLSEHVGNRRKDHPPAWTPTVKVVIEALGSTLSIVYGDETIVEVAGVISSAIAAQSSTAVVRLVIAHSDRRQARRQLGTGIDIMRVRFDRSKDDWTGLISRLAESGASVRSVAENLEDDASLDAPSDD